MKSFLFFFFLTTTVFSQSVIGKWKTIDDTTGKAKSIVEIYEEDNRVYGKVISILNPDRQDARCTECKGEDKNAAILGLVIIRGLQEDDEEYNDGKILDPESGKLYKCYITLEEENKLKVRGYLGFSLLGRTQYWYRVE